MQKRLYRCNDPLFKNDDWFQSPEEIVSSLMMNGYYPIMVRNVEEGLAKLQQIEKGEYRPVPSLPEMPTEFSLQDKMPPVYDQASRGTCVAQAATALMEYYCDCKWRFSMQYLFERIKRLEKAKFEKAAIEIANGKGISDPEMAKVAGSIIARLQANQQEVTAENVALELASQEVSLSDGSCGYMAMEVLSKYGICTYEKWPYSRQILEWSSTMDATRPDVPPGADEEAALHRLTAPYYVFPSPNNVEEIKRYLVGTDGNRPMPVMIGTLTLNHLEIEDGAVRLPKVKQWKVESALCDVTAQMEEGVVNYKVTGFDESTLQNEQPVCAMDRCITGAHEMLIVGYQDDLSVVGGGSFIVRNSWHKDWGREGYCKMPYAYAELFVNEATTIVQPMKHYSGSANAASSAATQIPEDLQEYVVKADREQKDRHGRWTIGKGMMVIIDKNGLMDRYTEQNAMLFRRQGFSWAPSVEKTSTLPADTHADIPSASDSTRLVLPVMEERFFSGLEGAFRQMPLNFPQLGGLRKGWFSGTGKATAFKREADLSPQAGNPFRLYSVSGSKGSFRIAAMYLKDAAQADEATGKAHSLLEEFTARHPFEPCNCIIVIIGSDKPITAVQPFISESEIRIVIDNYTSETGWRLNAEALSDDKAWCEWLLRLTPNSPAQWSALLEQAYETVVAMGGHVTLAKVAKAAGLPEGLVAAVIGKFAPAYQIKGDQLAKQ